jgi:hypothetical protein
MSGNPAQTGTIRSKLYIQPVRKAAGSARKWQKGCHMEFLTRERYVEPRPYQLNLLVDNSLV